MAGLHVSRLLLDKALCYQLSIFLRLFIDAVCRGVACSERCLPGLSSLLIWMPCLKEHKWSPTTIHASKFLLASTYSRAIIGSRPSATASMDLRILYLRLVELIEKETAEKKSRKDATHTDYDFVSFVACLDVQRFSNIPLAREYGSLTPTAPL